MAEYLARKGKDFYELAKFEDSDTPTAVYIFTERGCSCPSYRRSCKHLAIMKAWKRAGEPVGVVYDDTASVIATLAVA